LFGSEAAFSREARPKPEWQQMAILKSHISATGFLIHLVYDSEVGLSGSGSQLVKWFWLAFLISAENQQGIYTVSQ